MNQQEERAREALKSAGYPDVITVENAVTLLQRLSDDGIRPGTEDEVLVAKARFSLGSREGRRVYKVHLGGTLVLEYVSPHETSETAQEIKSLQEASPFLIKAMLNRGHWTVEDHLGDLDPAQKTVDAAAKTPGGIDLNAGAMKMNEQGQAAGMNFDRAMITRFKSGDFSGLTPVVLKIAPIADIHTLPR